MFVDFLGNYAVGGGKTKPVFKPPEGIPLDKYFLLLPNFNNRIIVSCGTGELAMSHVDDILKKGGELQMKKESRKSAVVNTMVVLTAVHRIL
jgi:hypothetical protein